MMMSLGQFVFSLPTLAYQQLRRQTEWRHADNDRVGARPADQFVGPGRDDVDLDGVLLPELAGDRLSLDTLRTLGDSGAAQPLVDGSGVVYGAYVVTSISETQTVFFKDGTPRRIEFQLRLKRVDDQRVAPAPGVSFGTVDGNGGSAAGLA